MIQSLQYRVPARPRMNRFDAGGNVGLGYKFGKGSERSGQDGAVIFQNPYNPDGFFMSFGVIDLKH
jgi:hypothetical protein